MATPMSGLSAPAPAVGNGKAFTPPASVASGGLLDQRVMLTFGALTEARVRQLLEEQLAAVWAAALESHGYDWREGWAIKFDDLRLERVGPPGPPEG